MHHIKFSVSHLSKSFGYKRVFSGVNFSLEAGTFTLLLGINGSGKSTLLRTLAGIYTPTGGEISLTTDEPQTKLGQSAQIAMLAHESHLYSDLSPRENLDFFVRLYRKKPECSDLNQVLTRVNLSEFSETPVKTFSHGMLKRVSIALTMLLEPRVLFLDEPYSGLDLPSLRTLNDFLKNFVATGGIVLLVTHQPKLGPDIPTRLLIMHEQKLILCHDSFPNPSETQEFFYARIGM